MIGHEPVLQARLSGKRPADLVLISLAGRVKEKNPVIIADSRDIEGDWRFLRGLEVALLISPETTIWQDIAKAIARCEPSQMHLVEYPEGRGFWLSVSFHAPIDDTFTRHETRIRLSEWPAWGWWDQ
jgi:hypothetical protein